MGRADAAVRADASTHVDIRGWKSGWAHVAPNPPPGEPCAGDRRRPVARAIRTVPSRCGRRPVPPMLVEVASVGHRHAGAGAWHRRLLALAGHPMARRWQLPVASMWLSRRPDQNAVPPQAWRCFGIVLDYLSRCIRAGNYLAEGAPNSAKEHLQLRNHYAINRKRYWRTEM